MEIDAVCKWQMGKNHKINTYEKPTRKHHRRPNCSYHFFTSLIFISMIEHKIVLQIKSGQIWTDLAAFITTSRYELSKVQRGEINALKYELELDETEYRVIKRKEVIK